MALQKWMTTSLSDSRAWICIGVNRVMTSFWLQHRRTRPQRLYATGQPLEGGSSTSIPSGSSP